MAARMMMDDSARRRRLRDESMNDETFDGLTDARQTLALWRHDHNNVRPHSSLGNKPRRSARGASAI